MADNFDVNKYKAENDLLTLTDEQKRLITVQMRQAEKTMKTETAKQRKPLWLKTVAAALAVAVIGTSTYLIADTTAPKKNGFVITVNAAAYTKDDKTPTYPADTSVVGAYSLTTGDNGPCMEVDPEAQNPEFYTKDGFKDYFCRCPLQNLQIVGKNIKSVALKANKKGTYFSVEGDCDWTTDKNGNEYFNFGGIKYSADEYKSWRKAQKKFLSLFTDHDSLENSQYTTDEFKAHYVNGGNIWCDGFTYNNPNVKDKVQKVLPNNTIRLLLEADHSDPEVVKLYGEWDKIGEKSNQIKKDYFDGVTPKTYEEYDEICDRMYNSDEYQNLIKEEEKVFMELTKIILDGATIDVTVTYADGTTESQTVNINFHKDTLRLTK